MRTLQQAILILLLASSAVASDSWEQSGERKAACQVFVSLGVEGKGARGSGTLIADRLVITAAHVVQGASKITCDFNGERVEATVIKADRDVDLATLKLSAAVQPSPITLAFRSPAQGSLVELWGFGANVFRSFDATLISRTDRGPTNARGSHGQTTVGGDSGGGAVYEGQLIGVHWGYCQYGDQHFIQIVPCETIREFMGTSNKPDRVRPFPRLEAVR